MKHRVAASLAVMATLVASLAASGAPALACSCEEVLIENAVGLDTPAAFVGEAVSVVEVGYREGVDQLPLIWTFAVDTVLQGELTETVEVSSGYDDGDCGVDFSRRGRVGVVAHRYGGGLATDICGGVWAADQLMAAYGPGSDPLPAARAAETVEPTASGPPVWFWLVGGAAVLLAGAGVVLARRGRDEDVQEGWRTPAED